MKKNHFIFLHCFTGWMLKKSYMQNIIKIYACKNRFFFKPRFKIRKKVVNFGIYFFRFSANKITISLKKKVKKIFCLTN